MSGIEFSCPAEKLPEIGQRVVTVMVKEMIYQGNDNDSGSDWMDDGQGFRAVMFWTDLKNLPAFIPQKENA
jgi:hypothetical protein